MFEIERHTEGRGESKCDRQGRVDHGGSGNTKVFTEIGTAARFPRVFGGSVQQTAMIHHEDGECCSIEDGVFNQFLPLIVREAAFSFVVGLPQYFRDFLVLYSARV